MKTFISVSIFTICFVLFSIFINKEVTSFVSFHEKKLDTIELYIEKNQLDNALFEFDSLYDSWSEDEHSWYKFFDHTNFHEIDANFKILKNRLDSKNKFDTLETIEIIKLNLEDILEDTKLEFNYIF